MSKETMNKILGEIDKVKTILQNINNSGRFPEIERDIVLSKLRNIYEFILLIQPDFSSEKGVEKDVVEKPQKIQETANPDIELLEETKTEASPKEQAPKASAPDFIETTKTVTIKVKDEILAQKFQSSGNFVHDALARYVDTYDISRKLQSQPLKDIFSAIGLNDKFLFTKELFNNDTDLYKSSIEKINQANNFNDAIEYIDTNFKWDFENHSVQKLLELVRRRFPSAGD